MEKFKSSRSESKDKTARLKELRDVIRDLSKEYGVDSQSVYNETRELRKLKVYSYLLNSQIAQKICEDLMAGIERVLSGEGTDIHIPRRYNVDTIVAKQDGVGLVLDLSGGKVTVSFRGETKTRTYPDEQRKGRPIYKTEKQKVTIEAKATRKSDAMDEIDAFGSSMPNTSSAACRVATIPCAIALSDASCTWRTDRCGMDTSCSSWWQATRRDVRDRGLSARARPGWTPPRSRTPLSRRKRR